MKTRAPRESALSAWLLAASALIGGCSQEPAGDPSSPRDAADPERPPTVAAPDDLQLVPGTSVRLAPPAGFSAADEFPGFVHMASGTSIMVSTLPGPFSEVRKGFELPEAFARNGMTLVAAEDLPQGADPGRLLRISQAAGRIEVEKWIWVFGSEAETVMVMGTCPDPEYLTAVHDAIVSARWEPEREVDVAEGLGFRVDEVEGLVLMHRTGDTLAYTSDGAPDPEQNGKPLFVIGPALGSGAVRDERAFAEARLRKLPLDDVEIRGVSDVAIDGLGGCEVLASARDDATGDPRSVLLVVLFEQENYWIATGICADSFEEAYFPRFRRAARSLRREER